MVVPGQRDMKDKQQKREKKLWAVVGWDCKFRFFTHTAAAIITIIPPRLLSLTSAVAS